MSAGRGFPAAGGLPAAPRRWLVPALVAAACVAAALGGDAWRSIGRYEPDAVLAGELWRLVSAHFVHLSPSHLWMNIAALAALALLFDPLVEGADWAGGTAVSIAAIDAGLLFAEPEVAWYVGLSGVLHGLLAFGALKLASAGAKTGWLLLAALAAKLAFEQWAGPLPFSEGAAGGRVIVAAHLYGAAGGALYYAIRRGVSGIARRRL